MRRELPLIGMLLLLAVAGLVAIPTVLQPSSVPSDRVDSLALPVVSASPSRLTPAATQRDLVCLSSNRHGVHVVEAAAMTPVGDAVVHFATATADGYTWSEARADSRGMAYSMGEASPALVAVKAPGFAPTAVAFVSQDGEQEIALQRAASLRIRFVDVDGEPVSGVATRLLPPLLRGRAWGVGWRRQMEREQWPAPLLDESGDDLLNRIHSGTDLLGGRAVAIAVDLVRAHLLEPRSSDEQGTVIFDGLPAANAWRWGVHLLGLVEVRPLHESVTVVDDRGIRTRAGESVGNLSGAVTLLAGQCHEITVTVQRACALFARIPTRDAELRPQVKLYHLKRVLRDGAAAAVELMPEGFTTAANDGSFGFEGVRPGAKVVRAFWRDTQTDYVFLSRTVLLSDGERRDLGTLQPLSGEFAVKVELGDRQGRAVDVRSVVGDAEPDALVQIEAWRRVGEFADSVMEVVRVPLGQEVRFHGFPVGSVRLRSVRGLGWKPSEQGRRVASAPDANLTLPIHDCVLLPLTVETRVTRVLELTAPVSVLPPLELWMRPVQGGPPQRLRVARNSDGYSCAVEMKLLPEPYEILVRTSENDRDGLVGRQVMDFSGAERQQMVLAPGSSATGVCLQASGEPLANSRLHWGREGWTRNGSLVWFISAETDAQGRFALTALPAEWKLCGARPGTGFETAGTGSEKQLYFVLPR